MGKSTTIKYIINALGVSIRRVAYAAYTGKAADVLKKKGNPGATTLHRLLYESSMLPNGKYVHRPKSKGDLLKYQVIVVDEISMVPKDMIDLLFSYNVYVIGSGDPFQIPPLDPATDNHLLDNPHVFLDEVMRQAAESEIIKLSMDIRAGNPLQPFQGKEVQILKKEELTPGMLLWADQILTATNATRIAINNQVRRLQGRGQTPESGDKVICLKNYWEDGKANPLVNGTIGYLVDPEPYTKTLSPFFFQKRYIHSLLTTLRTEDEMIYSSLNIDPNIINGEASELTSQDNYRLFKLRNKIGDVIPKEFAYGYAVTVHKAQGSQWDKILIVEERFPFDKVEHQRWLYTAITRAAEKVVIILK